MALRTELVVIGSLCWALLGLLPQLATARKPKRKSNRHLSSPVTLCHSENKRFVINQADIKLGKSLEKNEKY